MFNMKVVLLQDVRAQGKKGDIIDVSEGYARNFLLPKKLAVIADAKAINDAKAQEASRAHRVELEKQAAATLAEKLKTVTVTLTATAGADGRFYGSVTAKDVAEAVKEQCGIELDRRKIVMGDAIKAFGTYVYEVKLFPEIVGKLTVSVTEKQS